MEREVRRVYTEGRTALSDSSRGRKEISLNRTFVKEEIQDQQRLGILSVWRGREGTRTINPHGTREDSVSRLPEA